MSDGSEFMRKAFKEACNGVQQGDGGPFGAVIVDKDGKIVGVCHNEVLKTLDPTAHAEIVSIRRACQKLQTFNLTGCVMYTSCYPCPMCMGACLWSRLEKVYYGNCPSGAADAGFDDTEFHDFVGDEEKKKLFLKQLPFFTDEDKKLATQAFEDWKAKEDKIPF